jgi:hypothetical protein
MAGKKERAKAKAKAMGLQSMRRASMWCGSRMELLKCFSVPSRRDTHHVIEILISCS